MVRHGEWSLSEGFFNDGGPAETQGANSSDKARPSESDPHLQNAAACMTSWLLLESVFCTCENHEKLQDPDCLWCNDE